LKTPIIFLDIDGVLNKMNTTERFNGYTGIDKELLIIFNGMINQCPSDTRIVLSSTWRLYPNHLEYVRERINIFDVTPSPHTIKDGTWGMRRTNRGEEISEWISNNEGEISIYAVLDDDFFGLEDSGLKCFMTTDGITEEISDSLVEYLCGVDTSPRSGVV